MVFCAVNKYAVGSKNSFESLTGNVSYIYAERLMSFLYIVAKLQSTAYSH